MFDMFVKINLVYVGFVIDVSGYHAINLKVHCSQKKIRNPLKKKLKIPKEYQFIS